MTDLAFASMSASRHTQVVRRIADTRACVRQARQAGDTVALVPTMGALHAGHLSLIAAARERCDTVVVSIFVNPAQFDEQADLLRYPRSEDGDVMLASDAGADLLFIPSVQEIYKPGFATAVEVLGLTDRLEGAVRGRSHFRGVCTVVCKLLNIVQPDLAVFGQKDAQQAAVIKRMAADLDFDVKIETLPTVREPDGLAMSSRNARLDSSQRTQATALHAALQAAAGLASAGVRDGQALREAAARVLVDSALQPEYVALVDPETFEERDLLDAAALLLLAARLGETRLIDNALLTPSRDTAVPLIEGNHHPEHEDARHPEEQLISASAVNEKEM